MSKKTAEYLEISARVKTLEAVAEALRNIVIEWNNYRSKGGNLDKSWFKILIDNSIKALTAAGYKTRP